MRPGYLEVEGLHSFKSIQRIDFTALIETGLFGIFGPTGSGKSSVLDAITLALYGEVNRAIRGTQGIINSTSDTLKVSFAFDLLVDNKRKTYRVDRIYKRKKDSDNSCENRLARLVEIRDGVEIPMADKAGEVRAKVEEIIGLSFSDFTRSVVLPQNKFQEFLFLDKAKKRDMMERIFYLEEYGRQLSEKVNKRLALVRSNVTFLEGQLSGLGDASGEALEKAKQIMEKSLGSLDKITDELGVLETEYRQTEELWNLTNELIQVEKKERAHLMMEADINDKKRVLDRARKANEIYGEIKRYTNRIEKLNKLQEKLKDLEFKVPIVKNRLDVTKGLYEKALAEEEREKPGLMERRYKLSDALEIRKQLIELDNELNKLRQDYNTTKKQLDEKTHENNIKISEADLVEEELYKYREKLSTLKVHPDFRHAVQQGSAMEKELIILGEKIETIKKEYRGMDSKIAQLNTVRDEQKLGRDKLNEELLSLKTRREAHSGQDMDNRNDIISRINEFHGLKSLCDNLTDIEKNIQHIKTIEDKTKQDIIAYRAKLSDTMALREKTLMEQSVVKEELENLKTAYDKNLAVILAKDLKKDNPCPVCGSTYHPMPAGGALEDASENKIAHVEKRFNELEDVIKACDRDCIENETRIDTLEKRLNEIQRELSAKIEEGEDLRMRFPGEMKGQSAKEVQKTLIKMELSNKEKLRMAEEWEKTLKLLEEETSKVEKKLSNVNIALERTNSEININGDNLTKLREELDKAIEIYTRKEKVYKEFMSRWSITNAESELKSINKKDNDTDSIQKEIISLEEKHKNLLVSINKMEKDIRVLEDILKEKETDGRHLRKQRDIYNEKIIRLAGQIEDIAGELKKIDKRIADIDKNKLDLTKRLDVESKEYEYVNEQFILHTSEYESNSREAQNQWMDLEKALGTRGFDTLDDARNAIISEEMEETLKHEIDEYERELVNIRGHKQLINGKLNGKTIERNEWQRVYMQYQEKKNSRDAAISTWERARKDYEDISRRYDTWVDFRTRFKRQRKKMETLEEIQRLLKGNSFVEYIAEERMRYIAREATQILGILTKYRYALEIDGDSGFIIRDNGNGGVYRPVTSLSGGETFLTSLSLALALSRQIQLKNKSPLEFFFLDEGFGTLDGQLLDTVVDALERLSTKDRVIGLISHVPELRNRISRRLIIKPATMAGDGSTIGIERA